MSDSLQPHGLGLTRLFCPWDSLGKNIGVGSHFLLQEIFLTQGSNSGLLHCRQTLPCEPPGKNENQSIKNKVIFNVILCQGKLFHNQR